MLPPLDSYSRSLTNLTEKLNFKSLELNAIHPPKVDFKYLTNISPKYTDKRKQNKKSKLLDTHLNIQYPIRNNVDFVKHHS